MEERVRKRRTDAPEIGEVTRLTKVETRKLFPPLSDEYGAIHISGAARVNGKALCEALIRAAKKHGARFIQGEAKLLFSTNEVTGVRLKDELIPADQVIITAGAWSKELLHPLGIDFLIKPQKAQIVHLELPETNTDSWPVVMSPTNQYLLAFEGGKVIVGATHENGIGFDTRVTAGGLHEIFSKALMVAPGLESSTVVETKVGFRPVAPGFLPIIGRLPNYHGILVANGLGSSGLTVGPYLGAELAKLAQGEKTEIDIDLYDVAGAIGNQGSDRF
jgi:D-amino-acid dehydrogenase